MLVMPASEEHGETCLLGRPGAGRDRGAQQGGRHAAARRRSDRRRRRAQGGAIDSRPVRHADATPSLRFLELALDGLRPATSPGAPAPQRRTAGQAPRPALTPGAAPHVDGRRTGAGSILATPRRRIGSPGRSPQPADVTRDGELGPARQASFSVAGGTIRGDDAEGPRARSALHRRRGRRLGHTPDVQSSTRRRRPVPPRAGAARGALHGDLGRRPPGRAARHVRGPAAGRLADRAPRIVETPEGHQVWEFDGERSPRSA